MSTTVPEQQLVKILEARGSKAFRVGRATESPLRTYVKVDVESQIEDPAAATERSGDDVNAEGTSQMKPSVGRIVHYTLSEYDADAINRRLGDAHRNMQKHREDADGSVIHIANSAAAGEVFPMLIVRVWNEDHGTVNGQVFLDGNHTLWVTSVTPGNGGGHYAWPQRD